MKIRKYVFVHRPEVSKIKEKIISYKYESSYVGNSKSKATRLLTLYFTGRCKDALYSKALVNITSQHRHHVCPNI